MTKIFTTLLAVLFTLSLNAMGEGGLGFGKSKSPSMGVNNFEQGNILISIGYGAPNFGKTITGYASTMNTGNVLTNSNFGPMHGKVEFALSNRFGAGISVNYVSSNYMLQYDSANSKYNEGWEYSSIAFNIRFNWHFYVNNNVDMYAGGGIGYRTNNTIIISASERIKQPVLFPLGLEVTAGVRYFFTSFLGAYVEVGAAKSIIQGGLVVRL